ncbi:hypothetical protein MKW98_022903 [Papaver atlanticum]|uniref:Uncharacterized protein n=1 Tax=Papaver atlanticum TaxID=357466 RepID=A0AAD4TLS5_9MAGN|nr:hypothetical protein MKW98_022903 [Papaver atlanticum]
MAIQTLQDGRSGDSAEEMDRPVPSAIFVVNVDKNGSEDQGIHLDSLMYRTIPELTEEKMKKQEAEYIYLYRHNGGGASQVWLGSGR